MSFAAAVLARAGAAIAARAAREAEAGADTPLPTKPPTTPAPAPEAPAPPEAADPVAAAAPAEPAPDPTAPALIAAAEPPTVPEPAATPEPEPEPDLEARQAPEFHAEPQAGPEPEPEAAVDAAIAAPPEPPSALPQSPPADPEPTPPEPLPRTAPMAAYVPAWLVAPVLRIAIPDSPLGRGGAGRAVAGEVPTPPPAKADTIGFAGPEPLRAVEPPPSANIELFEAAGEPESAAEEAPAPPDRKAETEETRAPPATEPREEAEPASETVPVFQSQAADIVDREPVAAPAPAGPAPSEPDTDISADRTDAPEPPRAARPLGAPQSGSRRTAAPMPEAEAAGLPAVDLPPLVEPEIAPPDATDTAVGPTRDDRPTIRNRRLYRRVGLDAEFEIDGAAAKLLDLSMGGFAAANAPALAPNAVVPVTVRLAIDGVDISTRMRARMVYAETPRSGGRFIDLTAGQTAFLRYIVTWRGQSAGALGTATLLEAIGRTPDRYRPAETAALEPPGRAAGRTRWWRRMFGWFRARAAPG